MKTVQEIHASNDDREMMCRSDAWHDGYCYIKHKQMWNKNVDDRDKYLGIIIGVVDYEKGIVVAVMHCNLFSLREKLPLAEDIQIDKLLADGWIVD